MKALSIAMEIEVSFAPSIRLKWRRCVAASTTAMFIARPMDRAFSSHAATAILAASRVNDSVCLVAVSFGIGAMLVVTIRQYQLRRTSRSME